MEIRELSEKERDVMLDQWLAFMNIERRHPTKEELEREIVDYLGKNHPCSLATCTKDGLPRVSVVDYVNEGLTIYIFSEGGEKFKNLKENNRVAVGIGTSARTMQSVRGVNLWGIAQVFTADSEEFAHGLQLFSRFFNAIEKAKGSPIEFPKDIMRLIRITPTKMVYHHNIKGIKNAHWEA